MCVCVYVCMPLSISVSEVPLRLKWNCSSNFFKVEVLFQMTKELSEGIYMYYEELNCQ